MINTAGKWSKDERHVYFLAARLGLQQWASVHHRYILVAVNDLTSDAQLTMLETLLANEDTRILLDSGIFWLTNEHKRAHGMSMNDALALPPDQIDNFDWLWKRYIEIVQRWGNDVWGYIELDQGGMANKRVTRGKLHDLGFNPIPVYHPLNDGWEYFDELAGNYDRLCWGNVVQADRETRKRFLATAWERHREYPELWIHLLGLTPNPWLNAFPADSADSSTWLSAVRWNGLTERAMLQPLSRLDRDYQYVLGHNATGDPVGDQRCLAMSAVASSCMQRGWKHWEQRVSEEMGLPTYPAP